MTRLRSRLWFAVGPMVVVGTLWAAPPQALKGWGQPADPDNDCRFELKDSKLVISVPGTVHNLAAVDGNLNAPTVLSPVRGEFIAIVKSTGDVRPGPEPDRPTDDGIFHSNRSTGTDAFQSPSKSLAHCRSNFD